MSGWSKEWPHNADTGDEYYFVRREDRDEVVVMGFSMGKAWLNGVPYEQSEMRSHLFLGPLTPDDAERLAKLKNLLDYYPALLSLAMTARLTVKAEAMIERAKDAYRHALED